MKDNITYQAKCNKCDAEGKKKVYDGESARNLHTRSKEHVEAFKRKDPNNFMYKHSVSEHSGECDETDFSWKVLSKHRKTLHRQISEAVNISSKLPCENLNSKSEFNGQSVFSSLL